MLRTESLTGANWVPRGTCQEDLTEALLPSLPSFLRTNPSSRIVAEIMVSRGISTTDDAAAFISGGLSNLPHPSGMLGLSEAVDRLLEAKEKNEQIVVYGDYDVDGITATAVLIDFLSQVGLQVKGYIPDRNKEGYGLNIPALKKLTVEGVKLIVTVDTGISSIKEAQWAADNGVDLIITDHHRPRDSIPEAVAVINPLQEGCSFPEKNLSGVGLAIYLISAFREALEKNKKGNNLPLPRDYFDLAALGTICDIVPLKGANRIIVREGLRRMPATKNLGLRTLLEAVGLADSPIQPGHVGFILGPRLNSAGRMDSALKCLDLFLLQDGFETETICRRLENWNISRQNLEAEILEDARRLIQLRNLDHDRVIVVDGKDWPIGVIGIVASRLVEEFHRPVVVISVIDNTKPDGKPVIGRGSARTKGGGQTFPWYEILEEASDLLEAFGGHRYAAGLTISPDNIPEFRRRLLKMAEERLEDKDLGPIHHYDTILSFKDLSSNLWTALSALAPFGHGNPEPVFMTQDVEVIRRDWIANQGLRFLFQKDGEVQQGTWFPSRRTPKNPFKEIQKGDRVDILYSYHCRRYRGKTYYNIFLRDMRMGQ